MGRYKNEDATTQKPVALSIKVSHEQFKNIERIAIKRAFETGTRVYITAMLKEAVLAAFPMEEAAKENQPSKP